MAYNTPETVADYLARFQMEITHRGKGTFTPDHVKYSLTIANGGKDFSTTFESNPHVHGEPTITQVFGALASDAMVVRDYGMEDLYNHREDICRYGTLDQLKDMGIYAIEESLADDILNDLSYDGDYVQTDEAKESISSAIYATLEEKYDNDFAETVAEYDDIAGRVNPCAMSVETVRAVNEKGYDAVFAEQWKAELSECDIDPEAVSVDSEAHDMENGRDGLDGNAPEKDAPEKDDRDAQPPVDTDNR